MEMRILDAEGKECAPGEIGEICGRSPMMMPGYYKRPDLTEKAIVDGWLHTGDAGYVDEDGFLFLVDRIKDMIISGGVNVYPKDIEEIVIQYPGISEVAVFGVPDEKWGEVPVACSGAHARRRNHRPGSGHVDQQPGGRQVPAHPGRGRHGVVSAQRGRKDGQAGDAGGV